MTQATPTAESTLRRRLEARRRDELDELFREIDLIHQQHQRRLRRELAVIGTAVLTLAASCVLIAALLPVL